MQDSETSTTDNGGIIGGLTGQSLGGVYLLRTLIGIGGMAEVYRAVDLTLEREVAIKVLSAALATDEKYVRRFWTEAKQVAALNHPHIVPIYGFGEDEHGLFYHVMPLLSGGSLRDRLLHDGRLAPEEAIRLTRQVASALDAAHALGLVHRDVKPENILLDANGDALLTDFGIARDMSELKQPGVARTLARTGIPVGTPEYMAPEHLLGESTDQRADVYALGAVLYELLVGTPPFAADTPYAIAAQVLTAPLVPPSRLNGAVWPALEQVVLRALARDPVDRYPDVQSFSRALDLALRLRTDALRSATTLSPVVSASARTGGRRAGRRLPLALPLLLPAKLQQSRTLVAAVLVLVLVAAALVVGVGMGAGFLRLNAADTGGPPAADAGGGVHATGTTTPATATLTTASTVTANPTTTTPGPSASPTTPVPTTTAVPTATPLLTPTIVVSSNPLNFQPYPSPPTKPTNCVAVQTLTNTSAVDAQWSWQNSPSAGGWQYNTAGFTSSAWQAFPNALAMTTPAHSSVYIYIRTGMDTACASHATVATITVTGGNGSSFNASY